MNGKKNPVAGANPCAGVFVFLRAGNRQTQGEGKRATAIRTAAFTHAACARLVHFQAAMHEPIGGKFEPPPDRENKVLVIFL
jgi:hypothetical protein